MKARHLLIIMYCIINIGFYVSVGFMCFNKIKENKSQDLKDIERVEKVFFD